MCEKHFYAYDSLHGVEKFVERKLCSHAAHGKTCTITEEYRHPHNETPAPAHSTSRVTPSPPLSEASLAGYTGSDRSYQYINGKRVFVSHKRSPSHHLPTSEVQNESNVTLARRQGTVRPRSENLPPRFTTRHVRYRRRSISIPTTNIHRPHFGGQEAEDKTLRKKTRERIRPSEIDLSFYAPKVLNYAQDLDKDVKSGTYSENNSQKHPPKYLVQKDDSEAKPDLAVSNTNDTRLTRQILPTHETFPRDEDQKDSPESDGDSSSETSQKSAPESLFSTVSTLSSRTNQSLSQEQQGGTELLSDFLFNHPDLNQLYKIAGKKVDVTELQQHLRHFFRYYGQNLKKEASNYQERRASGFVYLFAGHVAKKVSRATVGQLSSRPNKPNRRNVDTWLKDPGSKYASGTDDPDDSDDPDDLSQEYPLLDSVKQFMESSAAFQVLKYDLRDWLRTGDSRDNQAENSQQEDLEVQTSEPRWAITETRLLRTLPEVLDSFLSILHPFLPELAIPLGKTRIRWACSCGQQFYDDFIELEDGALGLLQKSLQENGETKRNFGYIPNSLQVFLPAVEGLLADLRQRFRHAVTRIGKYCPLRFGATLPSHSGHNPALQSSPQGVGTPCASGRVDRVLLMSIDEGTKYTGLHERQLGSIENDQQLFAFLRRKYYEHKAMPPFFTVRSVALSFSEFLVDIAHFAEVRLHKTCLGTSCTCLPPIERVVDDDEYQCSPAPERPLGYAPPYSSKLLTHYFQNPQCVPDSKRDIFLQLPKRVGPLPLSGDRRVPGWGIHFEEDWHQPTLFLLIWIFFVVGGLAFGIAWSVSKGDVSSAFAVTASWMAIAPILFGFVMARSSARGR